VNFSHIPRALDREHEFCFRAVPSRIETIARQFRNAALLNNLLASNDVITILDEDGYANAHLAWIILCTASNHAQRGHREFPNGYLYLHAPRLPYDLTSNPGWRSRAPLSAEWNAHIVAVDVIQDARPAAIDVLDHLVSWRCYKHLPTIITTASLDVFKSCRRWLQARINGGLIVDCGSERFDANLLSRGDTERDRAK